VESQFVMRLMRSYPSEITGVDLLLSLWSRSRQHPEGGGNPHRFISTHSLPWSSSHCGRGSL